VFGGMEMNKKFACILYGYVSAWLLYKNDRDSNLNVVFGENLTYICSRNLQEWKLKVDNWML
jgi:sulfur relay (sulfurtransferase) DsrF/TusC family protein